MADKEKLSEDAKKLAAEVLRDTISIKDLTKQIVELRDKELKDWKSSHDLSRKITSELNRQTEIRSLSESLLKKSISSVTLAYLVHKKQTTELAKNKIDLIEIGKKLSSESIKNFKIEKSLERLSGLQLKFAQNQLEISSKRVVDLQEAQKLTAATIPKLEDELKLSTKNINNGNRIVNSAQKKLKLSSDLVESLTKQQTIYKGIDTVLIKTGVEYGKIKGFIMDVAERGLTMWIAILKASVERFIELDEAALVFRNTTHLLTTQMESIRKSAESISVNLAYTGVTISKAYEAATGLNKAFGTTALITGDMMYSTAQMAANLGLSVTDIGEFNSKFTSIAKNSGITSDDLIKSSAAMSELAGVAPKLVLEDMAKASGNVLVFLSKAPMQLMRATVAARRLGTDIKHIADSARGMLNYQESITSELEASALLNQNISFQSARQLAWEGKIVEAREESLAKIREAGDFTKLTVYQQEALAKAAGMQVDEVTKQLNQQDMLNELRTKDFATYKKYMDMDAKIKANDEAAKKNLLARGQEMAKQQLMQSEMNKLSASFAQIWVSIQTALLPIANAIMPVILFAAQAIAIAVKVAAETFGAWAPILLGIEKILIPIGARLNSLITLSTYFRSIWVAILLRLVPIFNFIEKMGMSIGKLGSKFSPILGLLGRMGGFIGAFVKFVPVIGWIITGIQFIVSLWKRFSDLFKSDEWAKGDWMDRIWLGIKAIGGAIYDVLLKPFVDIWEWLSKTFFGESPSKLGLNIVKGISSVGSMIFDFLISPFTKAWDFIKNLPFIKNLFGGAKDAAGAVTAQVTSAVSSVVEIRNLDSFTDVVDKLTAAVIKLGGTAGSASTIVNSPANDNASVISKLDELIGLLKTGAIGVNLDGRKVSSGLSPAGR